MIFNFFNKSWKPMKKNKTNILRSILITEASQMVLVVKNLPANAGDTRLWFSSWVGKISWQRAQQPPPVYFPENPVDGEDWQVMVHTVAKSRTGLKQLSTAQHMWRRKWLPITIFLTWKSHGQRSLATIHGVSESDMTERACMYILNLILKFKN